MKGFITTNFEFVDFTEMSKSQSLMVWECRNLDEIRMHMVNPSLIPLESHNRFVENLKFKENTHYFVVMKNSEFIGSVNIHIENSSSAERGIYLNPKYQGMGLSKLICIELYQYLRDNCRIQLITTKVFKDNKSSNALEHSLGAFLEHEDEKFYYYSKDLKKI